MHEVVLKDDLLASDAVAHIVGKRRTRPHRVTPFAVVEGRRVTYPAPSERAAERRAAPERRR